MANRFIASQQANWRNPEETLKCYRSRLGRFIEDHKQLNAAEFTVEQFANWKMSLKKRGYSAESINHYLSAVRAVFTFAEETGLVEKGPKLKRTKNELISKTGSKEKPLYTQEEINTLLQAADL